MTKAVSNRDICFIKAVLLFCDTGTKFCVAWPILPPFPKTIRVKKNKTLYIYNNENVPELSGTG